MDEFACWAHQSADDSDAFVQKWALEDQKQHPRREYGTDWCDWEEILGLK